MSISSIDQTIRALELIERWNKGALIPKLEEAITKKGIDPDKRIEETSNAEARLGIEETEEENDLLASCQEITDLAMRILQENIEDKLLSFLLTPKSPTSQETRRSDFFHSYPPVKPVISEKPKAPDAATQPSAVSALHWGVEIGWIHRMITALGEDVDASTAERRLELFELGRDLSDSDLFDHIDLSFEEMIESLNSSINFYAILEHEERVLSAQSLRNRIQAVLRET